MILLGTLAKSVGKFTPPGLPHWSLHNSEMLCFYAPKGQFYVSLGHRPRSDSRHHFLALKGRHYRSTQARLCRPFRALFDVGIAYPGRCPGLT